MPAYQIQNRTLTEQTYLGWIERYLRFLGNTGPLMTPPSSSADSWNIWPPDAAWPPNSAGATGPSCLTMRGSTTPPAGKTRRCSRQRAKGTSGFASDRALCQPPGMPANETIQGELNFGRDDPAGYRRWQAEQQAWLVRLRQETGLPIGRKVRVRLRDFDREFCGRLSLVELPLERRHARDQRLRIGSFEFTAAEIESCVRDD